MSADNGIYVAVFPTKDGGQEFRVAHGFASVIDELGTELYTQHDERDAIVSIFGGKVFSSMEDAVRFAIELDHRSETEYGIVSVEFDTPYGELPPRREPAPLPDGACEYCSSRGVVVLHDSDSFYCSNPKLAHNIVAKALRERCNGLNADLVARIVTDALYVSGHLVKE